MWRPLNINVVVSNANTIVYISTSIDGNDIVFLDASQNKGERIKKGVGSEMGERERNDTRAPHLLILMI